jgi:hypothetical protein
MTQKLRELKYEDSSIKLIEGRLAKLANLCYEGCIYYFLCKKDRRFYMRRRETLYEKYYHGWKAIKNVK